MNFLKSVENTNVFQGVSGARYWSLIFRYVYEKEGIVVPTDEPKAKFLKYSYPKVIEGDAEVFPNIARIPDAMLKPVDPTNPVLMEYSKTINPNDETCVLLSQSDEGSSKKSRRSKKGAKSTPEKTVPEPKVKKSPKTQSKEVGKVSTIVTQTVEPEVVEPVKETISLMSGVFKRIKQKAWGSRKSPDQSSSFSPSLVRKPHVTRQGVVVREFQAPVSPSLEKRRAKDMAKHISKKIKKQKLSLQDPSSEDKEEVPETPEIELYMTVSTPKKIQFIPTEDSLTKSYNEEVRTSDINAHVSDTDANVIMGEIDLNTKLLLLTQGIYEISTINMSVSLPPYIIFVAPITNSPTFDHVINHPFTSLFSSQSTDPPKSINDNETDDGGFGGTFADIEFDTEEEDIPDHMLMSWKQFKILNKKLNFILQSQADAGGSNYVSSIEVDVMLKAQEVRLFNKVSSLIQESES